MTDHAALFDRLKAILEAHASQLVVATDTRDEFTLNTNKLDAKGRPVFFGMVRPIQRGVAFHLMPVYCYPELLDDLSDALRKRLKGKSCFNFTKEDPQCFSELESLTQRGLEAYKADGKL